MGIKYDILLKILTNMYVFDENKYWRNNIEEKL
jgi:hypothetical protein